MEKVKSKFVGCTLSDDDSFNRNRDGVCTPRKVHGLLKKEIDKIIPPAELDIVVERDVGDPNSIHIHLVEVPTCME